MLYSKPNEIIVEVAKSNVSKSSFVSGTKQNTLKVNNSFVVRGWVDGKHVYFIERRNVGYLKSSKTVNTIKELKAAL